MRLLALVLAASAAPAPPAPVIVPQQSGVTVRLQAVSPATRDIVWASGVRGTWAVTTDGGRTWRHGTVPGADSLEFRDVEAVSATEAWLLAAGPGDRSRIYHTADGGATWQERWRATDPEAFADCFAFWTPKRALVMADARQGRLPVLRTRDGRTFESLAAKLPPAEGSEGAFAASGTCVATHGSNHAWIATGAGARARVLATTNGGETWTSAVLPIVQGASTQGAASVAFRDARTGLAAGGDLAQADAHLDVVARSRDGGRTWQLVARPGFPGAVYGLAWVPGAKGTLVATGPRGAAFTRDEGEAWAPLPGLQDFWAVGAIGRDAWLVGAGGRIVKVTFPK